MEEHPDQFVPMIEVIATLVKAGKCNIKMEVYELSTKFEEALQRATSEYRNAKVMFKMEDIGLTESVEEYDEEYDNVEDVY